MNVGGVALPSLMDVYTAWMSIPSMLPLIGHCLYCASTAPDLRSFFIVHYWLTFLTGFGGGSLSALLMMAPAKATISAFSNSTLMLIWTLCWWLINFSPFRIPGKVHALWPVKMVTKACVALSRSKLIVDRVSIACELYPGNVVGPVLVGTLAACGGKLVADTIRMAQGSLTTPHEANVPSYSLRSAFLASAFFFFTAKWPATSLLNPQEAFALMATLLVAHSLLSDLTGKALDWTQPIFTSLLLLANIPTPGANPAAPKKAAAARNAAQPVRKEMHQTSGYKTPEEPVKLQDQNQQGQVELQPFASDKAGAPDASSMSDSVANKAAARSRKKTQAENGWTEVVYGAKKMEVKKTK